MLRRSSGSVRLGALGAVGAALVLIGGLLVSGSGASAEQDSSTPERDRHSALTVNLGLTGTATATSSQATASPNMALDGNAATAWCTTAWTGAITVDLGQARALGGFGFTLTTNTQTSEASIAYATDMSDWHNLSSAQNMPIPFNEPVYVPASVTARFARLTVTDWDGSWPCIGEFRLFGREPDTTLKFAGADLSFTPQEEAAGAVFRDNGVRSNVLDIFKDHGLNYVRVRLWVNPPPGYSNLTSDLAFAKRIKAAGMKLYLDIHYSDFWADPQHENTPSIWAGQDLSHLSQTVQNYTQDVMQRFADQDTPVDMVSIGNEIRNGFLWPVGQVDWTADTGWSNLTTLLKSGVAGARAGNPKGHPLLVMIHFDQGGDNTRSRRFFDHMIADNVPFDIIGLSYYSFFHGSLTDMRTNVDDLATRYSQQIVIAESQYAWTLAQGDNLGDFVWQPSMLEKGYPASPGGQLSFYNDLLSILAQVPNGKAIGLFYWSPEWIPGVGWNGPGTGTPNDNLTLFNFHGAALPSIGLFQNPIGVCTRYEPSMLPCSVPIGATAGLTGDVNN
jgi:arabinogalactan endo-1,4-beta-galactosidase